MVIRNRWPVFGVSFLCLLVAAGTINVFGQTERWMFTYDGPGHMSDTFPSTIVGGDGNVYSAGYGYGSDLNLDFLVVSVDPSGNQRWTYTYDNNGHDGANAIVYGPGGRLYVVGASADPPSDDADLVVVCLDSAGSERWVYRYNDPDNAVDIAHDIHVDADGNLYIAGYSGGMGTEYDAIAISLTAGGFERWVYRYDGPMNGQDRAYCVTSGPNNRIYIGGYAKLMAATDVFTVIALDTAGTEKWVFTDSGPYAHQNAARAFALDPDGNLLAAGTSGDHDFAVFKLYWKTGAVLWSFTRPTATFNQNRANAVICGDDGNVYVAGSTNAMFTDNDFAVVGLDGDGNQRWIYGYNGTADQWDEAWSLVRGPDGDLYAAGQSHSASTGRDALVVSLDTDGNFNWQRMINGSIAAADDGAESVACGAEGHLYIGGFISNDSGRDLMLVKLDTDNTVSAEIDGTPAAGPLPLETVLSINLANNYRELARTVAARVDITLAGGQVYSGWRSGYMNIQSGDCYMTSLPAIIPLSPSTLGENRFRLLAEDVTPFPYNQPPYPPSGDADTDLCIVTGNSP